MHRPGVCASLLLVLPPALLPALLPAVVPPLTEQQRTRLETAVDGADHREEAFLALAENAASFTREGPGGVLGAAAVRLHPDLDAMMAAPDDHRGALCRVVGSLQQRTPLARPYDVASEWFLRDESGRPMIVYVVGITPAVEAAFPIGRGVAVYARFYKPVDAVARDERLHRYPAFVGAHPWRPGPGGVRGGLGGAGALVIVAALVAGLAVVLVVVVLLARRAPPPRGARVPRPRAPDAGADVDVDEGPALPDDPAAALAELRRRAETEGR